MNLLHQDLSWPWALAGFVLLLPALLCAVWQVRRGLLPDGDGQNLWLGGALLMALLWCLHVHGGSGIELGLLGCSLYAVTFGWARSFLGLLLALVLHTTLIGGSWANFGANAMLFACLPSLLADRIQWLIPRCLPHNLFIFVFGSGLFVTLVVTVATDVALMLSAMALVPDHGEINFSDTLSYALLLGWGEAFISGLVFSALVVYLPNAVVTFDRDLYLPELPRSR